MEREGLDRILRDLGGEAERREGRGESRDRGSHRHC